MDIPKTSFAPLVDEDTRILILGSLPGEQSFLLSQYYGNPRNQFWTLLGEVLGRPFPHAYEDRLAMLRQAGVGLWDVVKSATRTGSLDANIRGHEANALAALTLRTPALRAIAFNGATSSKIGRRELGEGRGQDLITLPSSSPALTMAFERKLAAWSQLRPYLA
jgi:TDG/mug DNA glycosylase family protein